MTRKHLILLLGAVTLFSAACHRIEEPAGGTVTLTFHAGEPATRAETPGDGNVADGGGIYCTAVESGTPPDVTVTPDLVIFIANEDGIIKRYPGDGTLVENDYVEGTTAGIGRATTLSISFNFTAGQVGSYSVFAVANKGGSGGTINIPDLSSISSISELNDLIIDLNAADASPEVGGRMPLSAMGTLNVAQGLYGKFNGLLELEMLRCVAKVQLSFINLTGAALDLHNCQIKFKDMDTRQAWLFQRDPDFVERGDSNTDGKDDNYRDYDTSTTAAIANLIQFPAADNPATTDVDERVKDAFDSPLLFFPSIAPMQSVPSAGKRYLCDISFRIKKASAENYDPDNSSTYEEKTFTDLPIHNRYSQDILALSRNQYLQIETTISKGGNVSFNFIVNNWTPHNPKVIFN